MKKQFVLDLDPDTVKALETKAFTFGTTPEEVLEDFINNLVCGQYSRGSDERDLAGRYFDRCGYGLGMDPSFTQWALSQGRLDEIEAALEAIADMESDLEYFAEYPEAADPEEVRLATEDKTEAEKALSAIYEDYRASTGNPETYKAAMDGIMLYLAEGR